MNFLTTRGTDFVQAADGETTSLRDVLARLLGKRRQRGDGIINDDNVSAAARQGAPSTEMASRTPFRGDQLSGLACSEMIKTLPSRLAATIAAEPLPVTTVRPPR